MSPSPQYLRHSASVRLVWLIDPRKSFVSNPMALRQVGTRSMRLPASVGSPTKDSSNSSKTPRTNDLRFILYCGFHAGLRRDES